MRIGQQADLKSAIRRESVSGSNPESSAMESYAKLVEAASLEMRCDGFRLVSSNLTLSALGSYAKWPKQLRVLVNGVDGIDHLSCRFESYAFHHGRHANWTAASLEMRYPVRVGFGFEPRVFRHMVDYQHHDRFRSCHHESRAGLHFSHPICYAGIPYQE